MFIVTAKVRKLGERRPQRWKLHIHPTDPKAAAYVRNDGEVKWHLNDLDVATVEELHPEGAMEVQNLRALGMGWAWYVNDLSKYLPDAETLADMTPAEDISVGMDTGVPLKEIGLEPEVDPERELTDPYVIDVPFPHVPPGPAETELMEGGALALLPRSQEVDLVVSAVNIPMPWQLRKALKPWSREDLARSACRWPEGKTGARCCASAGALPDAVRPVVVLRGEDGSAQAQAREAHVQENGGVEDTSSIPAREAPELKNGGESRISLATNEQQSLSFDRPEGKEKVGRTGSWDRGDRRDCHARREFCTPQSLPGRGQLVLRSVKILIGWQNEELTSDRWVKIADQPEVTQLTKQDEPLGMLKGSEPPKPREEQIPGKSMEKTLVEEVAVSISTCGSKSMRCADQRRFLQTTRGFLTKDTGLMSHSLRNPLQGISQPVALGVLQALPLASRFCGVTGVHTVRRTQRFPSKEFH